MGTPLTLLLARHGQSEANLDNSVNVRVADHAIDLSPEGQRQAIETGRSIAAFLRAEQAAGKAVKVALYVSPYRRTRQTADGIASGLVRVLGKDWFDDAVAFRKESIFLREMEFGLFDGIPDDQLAGQFPKEHDLYAKQKSFEGEFYARLPLGESRCDVAERVHQAFGTIQRDAARHGTTHVVVVSHGITLRQFAMMWCDLGVDWVEKQRNPKNGSVRLIVDGSLSADPAHPGGYLFAGFDMPHDEPKQEKRESGTVD